MNEASSINKAQPGNFVVISLLSKPPFPRLSVQVSATVTFLRSVLVDPKKSFRAMRIARASGVEITKASLSSRS